MNNSLVFVHVQNECFPPRGRARNYFLSFPVEMEGLPEGHKEKVFVHLLQGPVV